MPLKYKLHSGDTVEILRSKKNQPHKDWLKFVRPRGLKRRSDSFYVRKEHENSAAIGRDQLEKTCRKYGLSINQVLKSKELAEFAEKSSYNGAQAILAAIGYGKFSPMQIVALFKTQEELHPEEVKADEETVIGKLVGRFRKKTKGMVKVGGISDMLVNFGKCCNPVPGDPIIGFITRGRGVTIHVRDCPRILGQNSERLINVEWDLSNASSRVARVRVVCMDRIGMLAKMTEAITDAGANIAGAAIAINDDSTATNCFDVEIKDLVQLRNVIKSLERVKGIISVERVRE